MTEINHRTQPVQTMQRPEVTDLLEPLQMLFGLRPQSYGIRVETHYESDAYIVRGEMPGIDPVKDVEVTVSDGILTIHAERTDQQTEHHHSEFRYGSYDRSMRLPEGTKPDKVTAKYDNGILTVRVGLDKPSKAASHKIKVVAGD
jgi:HSP20 family molecular chaperone IbpA